MTAPSPETDAGHPNVPPDATPDDPLQRDTELWPFQGRWITLIAKWGAGALGIAGAAMVIAGIVIAFEAGHSADINAQTPAPGPIALTLAWAAILVGFLAAFCGQITLYEARRSAGRSTWARPLALTGCISGCLVVAVAAGGLFLLFALGSTLTG